jgi:hypothetical protein
MYILFSDGGSTTVSIQNLTYIRSTSKYVVKDKLVDLIFLVLTLTVYIYIFMFSLVLTRDPLKSLVHIKVFVYR